MAGLALVERVRANMRTVADIAAGNPAEFQNRLRHWKGKRRKDDTGVLGNQTCILKKLPDKDSAPRAVLNVKRCVPKVKAGVVKNVARLKHRSLVGDLNCDEVCVHGALG